jgi:hypothetical protein
VAGGLMGKGAGGRDAVAGGRGAVLAGLVGNGAGGRGAVAAGRGDVRQRVGAGEGSRGGAKN